MAKMPAFQFYPGDWRKDPGVNALNRHDRSVWFDMLCIMHESEQRGVLLLAGKPMPEEALARLLFVDESTLKGSLKAIFDYGVAGRREEDNAIVCRRMVKDEQKRQGQVEDGKRGGNPALCENYNTPGFVYAIQRASDGAVKIGISVNPSKRIYKLRYENKHDSLELLATMHADDMGSAEAELHRKYAHCGSGEWFSLKGDELGELLLTLKGSGKVKPTPSSSSSSSSSSSIPDTANFILPDWINPDTWAAYLEVRISKRAKKTLHAWNLVVRELEKFRAKGYDPNAVLETSIRANWTDVYEPKDKSPAVMPKREYIA